MDLVGEMLYGSLRKMVIPGFLWGSIHRRGADLAEIGEFLKSRTLYFAPPRCNIRVLLHRIASKPIKKD